MRFFVVLATLGTLAACNTTADDTTATYNDPNETLGEGIASPTDGFDNETGIEE